MKLSELLHDLGRPVAYSPKLAILIGVKECVLFSQLIYWSDKAEDGWIYKSIEELEAETGLSRHEQLSTRKSLSEAKLIETRNDRQSHRMYYKVCTDALDQIWEEKRSLRQSRDTSKASSERWGADPSDGSGSSSVPRTRSDPSDGSGLIRPTDPANKTETTVTETTNKGATSAPRFNEFVAKWFNAFQEHFDEPYDDTMMGKDGRHLSRLLKTNPRTVDELISIAKKAWARHSEFGFGLSLTITGFCTNLNTIVAKLSTNGHGNPEGNNRREHLSSPVL